MKKGDRRRETEDGRQETGDEDRGRGIGEGGIYYCYNLKVNALNNQRTETLVKELTVHGLRLINGLKHW